MDRLTRGSIDKVQPLDRWKSSTRGSMDDVMERSILIDTLDKHHLEDFLSVHSSRPWRFKYKDEFITSLMTARDDKSTAGIRVYLDNNAYPYKR